MSANRVGRNYMLRFGISIALYLTCLFAARHVIATYRPDGVALAITAVVPALPLIGVVWAVAMLIAEQTDEYLRMRTVRQVLVATGFALAGSTVLGFLAEAGVVAPAPLFWNVILWAGGLAIEPLVAAVLDRRRSRA